MWIIWDDFGTASSLVADIVVALVDLVVVRYDAAVPLTASSAGLSVEPFGRISSTRTCHELNDLPELATTVSVSTLARSSVWLE